MIKLVFDKLKTVSLIRSKNSYSFMTYDRISQIVEREIKIGTDLLVESTNTRPEPHRGKYYLLYMKEFESVYLIYVSIDGFLRIVYNGDLNNAMEALYRNVSSGTVVKVLKSSNVRAYRVVKNSRSSDETSFVDMPYKNKSRKLLNQTYLTLFEALNLAVTTYKNNKDFTFTVVTPKNTELFSVGLV